MRPRHALIAVALTCLLTLSGGSGGARSHSVDPYRVEVVQTNAELSQRLARLADLEFGLPSQARRPVITVDDGVHYQTVEGFGAAMTDTSAWLIERKLGAAPRRALMRSLFAPAGIRLNFVRVPIGASDFTRDGHPYTYDDRPAGHSDPSLEHFSIAHDRPYVLPALREVLALDPQTLFLASPWTAPAWMKSNGSLGNARNLGALKPAAYGPWGEYFAGFIAAYARAGVPIAAVTVQNEPGSPTSYPGLNLPAAAEARWIVNDLVPALARAGEHPMIYAGDLGWGPHSARYLDTVVSGPAGRMVAGLAWHCYFGVPGVMAAFHARHPRLRQAVDECSPGGPTPTPIAEIVIASMREWASSVALWNLVLDRHGGPVQPPNRGCPRCLGLATIDQRTGAVALNRSYYQLGQASAFVARGAQRVASTQFVSYIDPHSYASVVTAGVDDVAFRNPDGSIVLVAYNNSPAPARFTVAWRRRGFGYELPAQAMVTFVWNRPSRS